MAQPTDITRWIIDQSAKEQLDVPLDSPDRMLYTDALKFRAAQRPASPRRGASRVAA
jgi:hypothetical protein